MKTIKLLEEMYTHEGDNSNLKVSMKSKFIAETTNEYIKTINPRNEIDMRETFEGLYKFLANSKGSLEKDDVNAIFLEVVKKLEDIQLNICPVLVTTGKFKVEGYKEESSLTSSALAYVTHIENSFLAIDESLKKLATDFYKQKTEVVRKMLNTLETLCLTY